MNVSEYLEQLTRWPHRGSTTEYERQAAEYLHKCMEEMGLETRLEHFVSHTSFSWIYLIIYGGFLLGGAFGWNHPFFGLLVCCLMFALFYGECTSLWKGLAGILPKRPSQNVLGVLPNEKARKKVVLVAHYDTSKSGLNFHPSAVGSFRRSFLLSIFIMALLIEVLVIRFFEGEGTLLYVLWLISLVYLLSPVILLLHREMFGQYVQGAADNASGVASMLAVAKKLSEKSPAHLEVWCLATGCEEVNLVGMAAFLRAHQYELNPETTYFLNFDNLGSGSLRYITAEGVLRVFPSACELVAIADRLSQREQFSGVRPYVYKRATLDALVASSRGYKTMSLMALNENDEIVHWHWPSDILENVDVSVAEKAAAFAHAVLAELDIHVEANQRGEGDGRST